MIIYIDFKPHVKRISNIIPLCVVVTADKAYDSEDNHLLIREQLGVFSVIPARHKERYPNMEYTWKIQKTNR